MRLAQGMPVNMIVLTALALLVLVVVGAFFISGFGQASSSVNIVDASQAECQSIRQTLTASGYNYDKCIGYTTTDGWSGLAATNKAIEYMCRCDDFGAATVTLRDGSSCSLSKASYAAEYGSGFDGGSNSEYNTLCSEWLASD